MIQLIAQKIGGSIREVCAVLGEARSSLYHAAAPTDTQVADIGLGDLIEAVFRRIADAMATADLPRISDAE